jgi:hypothetical protein
MRRAAWTFSLLLVSAAGCGGGVDGKPISPPVSPPATPAPVDRSVPVQRASVWVHSEPDHWDGYNSYVEGNVIRLIAEFEESVSVQGSPRLAIEIGETVRHAAFSPWVEDDFPPERLSFKQRFDYMVHWEDRDENGISIGADAFDLSDGTFLNAAGEAVEVEIYSVTATSSGESDPLNQPGRDLGSHPVAGRSDPRVCTDERERARAYGREYGGMLPLLDEWDGTPFRFYWDDSIPASERADAEHFFDVVEQLSQRIEAQIGYSILEVGGWIGEDERGFRIAPPDIRGCTGVRPGGIVGTVVPKLQPTGSDLVAAGTKSHCAVLFWTSNDIDTQLDGVMAHELFHLFGFAHHPLSRHPRKSPPGVGVPMSVHLSTAAGYRTPRELGVTYEDVDALRCVFPKNGSPAVR